MLRITDLTLPLDHTPQDLTNAILKTLKIQPQDLTHHTIFRRSIDARKPHNIQLVYTLDIHTPKHKTLLQKHTKNPHIHPTPDTTYQSVTTAPNPLPHRPIVIGNGPCGTFAALILAQMGFRPILLERGQPVQQRSRDTFGFWTKAKFNPESNAQYGEGGAGTFSDGKLYSRIKDRDRQGRKVLTELVNAGANPEILYINKPHIGTYRLTKIVQNLRHTITQLGGEIRYQSRVTDLHIDSDRTVQGVTLQNGEYIPSHHIILAIGHSARDTFQMLSDRHVHIDPKPFAIGFRLEHPQPLINQTLLGQHPPHPLIGAADYKLTYQASNGRAVYSFCMCPGGQVVAATSTPHHLVTNGMSQYERSGKNANAGIVVTLDPTDFPPGPLGGMHLQSQLEQTAYILGGSTYKAPAQRLEDFLLDRPSTHLGIVQPSYRPGIHLTNLSPSLPPYAITAIREAIPHFDRQLPGFALPDALLTGIETRTSSPIRITRGPDHQSLNTKGLYPAGEGAGYAGGILSAAVDGIKTAEALALAMNPK